LNLYWSREKLEQLLSKVEDMVEMGGKELKTTHRKAVVDVLNQYDQLAPQIHGKHSVVEPPITYQSDKVMSNLQSILDLNDVMPDIQENLPTKIRLQESKRDSFKSPDNSRHTSGRLSLGPTSARSSLDRDFSGLNIQGVNPLPKPPTSVFPPPPPKVLTDRGVQTSTSMGMERPEWHCEECATMKQLIASKMTEYQRLRHEHQMLLEQQAYFGGFEGEGPRPRDHPAEHLVSSVLTPHAGPMDAYGPTPLHQLDNLRRQGSAPHPKYPTQMLRRHKKKNNWGGDGPETTSARLLPDVDKRTGNAMVEYRNPHPQAQRVHSAMPRNKGDFKRVGSAEPMWLPVPASRNEFSSGDEMDESNTRGSHAFFSRPPGMNPSYAQAMLRHPPRHITMGDPAGSHEYRRKLHTAPHLQGGGRQAIRPQTSRDESWRPSS